jgi:hypothetical protein
MAARGIGIIELWPVRDRNARQPTPHGESSRGEPQRHGTHLSPYRRLRERLTKQKRLDVIEILKDTKKDFPA